MSPTLALPAQAAGYSRRTAAAVLVTMVLVTLGLDLARLPMNVLVDPIRRTLAISDVQISLLIGAFGAVPFVIMSILGGWLSDRVSRRLLLAAAVLVWTAGAVVVAVATSFEMLVAGRVLLGVGSGIKLPLAMTWVNDAFPPQQRGRAIGAFFVVLGSGPSLAIMAAGGVQRLAEGGAFVGLSGWIGAEPWRATLLLLALPSLLAIPFVFALPDVRSGRATERGTVGGVPAAKVPVLLIASLAVAAALLVLLDGANLAWMPTVFTRNYGYDAAQAGFAFGIVTLIGGAAGPLIGGWVGDVLYARHGLAGRIWLAAGAALLCVPLLGAYLLRSPSLLLVTLTLNGICTVTAMALTYVNAQALLPAHLRGFGTGIISAGTHIVGSTGPTLVALSSQHLLGGSMALPQSIALVGGVVGTLAAVVLALCARGIGRGERSGPAGA